MHIPPPLEWLEIQSIELKKTALIFRAVNHQFRQQMLHLIHRKVRVKVTDIFVALRLEQSVVSQHLAILRRAGLVYSEREGKTIYYSVNYNRLRQLHSVAEQLLKE